MPQFAPFSGIVPLCLRSFHSMALFLYASVRSVPVCNYARKYACGGEEGRGCQSLFSITSSNMQFGNNRSVWRSPTAQVWSVYLPGEPTTNEARAATPFIAVLTISCATQVYLVHDEQSRCCGKYRPASTLPKGRCGPRGFALANVTLLSLGAFLPGRCRAAATPHTPPLSVSLLGDTLLSASCLRDSASAWGTSFPGRCSTSNL